MASRSTIPHSGIVGSKYASAAWDVIAFFPIAIGLWRFANGRSIVSQLFAVTSQNASQSTGPSRQPSSQRRRTAVFFWGLLAIAMLLRLAAVVVWQARFGDRFLFGDSESYWELARRLASGEPYQFGECGTMFRTPGYPLVLAPLFLVLSHPPILAARILGCVLGACAVVIIAKWAQSLFGERTGRIAGVIAAVHPELVMASVLVLSEAAFLPVWCLHLLWLGRALQGAGDDSEADGKLHLVWAGLAGITAGLATLIRPSALLWLVFAAVVGVIFRRPTWKSFSVWAVALVATCLVMLPWWIRNWTICGQFVSTTTQVGASLYDGLNPQATGGSDMQIVADKLAEWEPGLRPLPPIQHELELDRRFKKEARAWARAHPWRVGELVVIKFRRFWNPVPNDAGLRIFPVSWIVAGGLLLTLVFAGVGTVVAREKAVPRERRSAIALCWLPALYFTLLHVVFVASIRYRVPAIPGLVVLAAAGLDWLYEWVVSSRDRANRGLENR